MNVVDLDVGHIGCFGIVGGSIAAATGAALATRRSGGVAVAFFGDGATNHGYFFECLNFAKVMALPLVLVCENNQYGEYTPFEAVTAGPILARPEAMGIPATTIDGMDVLEVRSAAADAVERARAGEPVFLEAVTYRFVGHSRSDPGAYRPPGELERWRERDPLLVSERRLGDAVAEVQERVGALMTRLEEQGLAAPFPVAGTLAEFAP